ncbi:MAG TPA: response regulator [Chthoniobacteraceae bacterium]|jgi:signal transduction histidine kinase
MNVRTTIFLLLLLLGTAFVAGLVELRRVEAEKFTAATAALQGTWRSSADAFWARQGESLGKMVEELPERDGVLAALLGSDRRWAAEAWDDRTLASFEANAVWVFGKDGALFYQHANTPSIASVAPLTPEELEKTFSRAEAPHFFLPLQGERGALRILEVRGKAVRPSWDADRKEAPEGFFLAGRIWDDERLNAALPPGNDLVSIRTPEERAERPGKPSRMQHAIPLRDVQGRDIARLVFTHENPALMTLEARGNRVFFTLLIGALALFLTLFLLLLRAIVRPLRIVIRSLHSEDLSLLEPLRKQRAEFGELARLLHLFFAQRTELLREMNERSAAEKALRESEEMLRHSQKMEAVGRLAGGVAHDFNNLLTAIIGYADLLRQRFPHDPAACQPAELIHQAGEQAAGLTRQLLAFSRKQLLQPKVIDLNVIVTGLHRLLQRIIGEHIEIRTVPEALRPCVSADPGQIEQVIVNLGVNARDAMPRGGKLTIRTVDWECTPETRADDLPPGVYVALEVTDTGEGMDAETRGRIFEPFFTTKGPGKGTGLGLATVYGIVRQSHGGIVVESEPGSGSTFRILLPWVAGFAATEQSAPTIGNQPGGAETILVVEDEEIVRELVCEVLRGHGYRVLETARGIDAADLIRKEGGRIDLLISDVVMPEMNGAEVARAVRLQAPQARVLFVSGYSENDMADQGMEVLAFEVLQKPFTPGALIQKVREVLDAPRLAEAVSG